MISPLAFLLILLSTGRVLGDPTDAEEPTWLRAAPPARVKVVIAEDPRSVFAFNPESDVVEELVNRAIVTWTGKTNAVAAWRGLVSTQDTIGIKVFSSPGRTSGTRPCVVAAIVKGLLAAGLPPKQIIIWDKRLSDLQAATFVDLAERFSVQVAGAVEEGYDTSSFYESALLGRLVWGDLEFGKKGDLLARKSYVSKLLTQRITKVINVTPLLNHNLAQVSGNLYSLAMGSVDNNIRFETGPGAVGQLNQAVPELYALPQVGDKVLLNIVDALICQYQGEEQMLLHYSTMLGQIRISSDPVALDVLSIQELERQRERARVPTFKIDWQLYTNAALLELGICDPKLIDVLRVRNVAKP